MLEFASTDVIATYVEKHKDKLYTGQTLTFSIGMMVAPPLLEYLIEAASYRTALTILAMLNLLSFPIAFVYRGKCCAQVNTPVGLHRMSGQNNAAFSAEENDGADTINNQSTGTGSLQSINCNVDGQKTPTASERTEFHGEIKESEMQKISQQTSDGNGQTTSANEADTTEPESPQLSVLASHIFVLKDPLFIQYLFYNLFAAAGEMTFYAFAVDYSVSMDVLSLTEAALGMTLASVSFFVAAILLTILSHWQLDRLLLSIFSILIMGLAILGVSLSQSMAAMYTCYIIVGFAEGLYVSNQVCYIDSYFAQSEFMIVRLSYVFTVTGIGALVGPIVAGHFAEYFGMKYIYFFIGGLPLLGFFILLPYWIGSMISVCKDSADSN